MKNLINEQLIADIKASFGITFAIVEDKLQHPSEGYMVSLKEFEMVVPEELLTVELLLSFCELRETLLNQNNTYVGVWIKEGKAFLDISVNKFMLDNAIKLGMQNDQLAIFDVKRGLTINLPNRQTAGTLTQQASYIQLVVDRIVKEHTPIFLWK